MSKIDALNNEFAIPEQLTFKQGPGGLATATIANAHASAEITLHGAHLLAYRPRGQEPVLWLSKKSYFEPNKPIRGGIPVCWPWFSKHRTNPDLPSHGFARLLDWEVAGTKAMDEGGTQIRLRLQDSEATRAMWPHAFELELQAEVGAALRVRLSIRNPGNTPYECTGALHTYFNISDITQIRILGLQHVEYLETIYSAEPSTQQDAAITFDKETDRVYRNTDADCLIEDPGLDRGVRNHKVGSLSTVVWNPWTEKAKRMPDYADDEFPTMVCVETANTEPNQLSITAGSEHVMEALISIEGQD